jgi:hypothetical protein
MNKLSKRKTTHFVFLLAICYMQIIFESINQTAITSVLFYLSIVVSVWIWIQFDLLNKSIYNIIAVIAIVLAMISILVDSMLYSSFNIIYFKKAIFFAVFLLTLRSVMTGIDINILKKWHFRLNTGCSL